MYLKQGGSLGLLSTLYSLPEGADGVRQTLYLMRKLVQQYKTDPNIRDVAAQLVQHLDQKDWTGEVRTLQEFVRDRIRYVRDIEGVETIQTPDKTLTLGYGDCDDKATLLATLLQTIGHPARFVAVGMKSPGEYEHVYVETLIGRDWVAAETTEPVSLGWKPPNPTSKMIVSVK